MKTLTLLLATTFLLAAAPAATAEEVCAGPACAGSYSDGQDCDELQAEGSHGAYVTAAPEGAWADAGRTEECFPTREGGVTFASTGASAGAGDASAGVDATSFTDRYWGHFEWRALIVTAYAEAPTGNRVEVTHIQAGFNDPFFPDPPFCYTEARMDDTWVGVERCPVVAPWLLLP